MQAALYLSSFLNQTTSRYNNLKKALISSDADGDTEDDSHISRVLRAYYTEKGRPFPEWLPPDPKAPPPPMPSQYASSSNQSLATQSSGGRWGRSGGLSDLWDTPSQQHPQQQAMPQSLRPRFDDRSSQQAAPSGRSGRFGDLYDSGSSSNAGRMAAGSRYSAHDAPAPSPAPSTGSAKDMLKAKLWGGRTGSPTPSTRSSGYAPPPRQESPLSNRTTASNPYESDSGGRGGYGTQSQYSNDGGGYGGSSSRPGLSSNSSWSGESSQSRGYGGDRYGQQSQSQQSGGLQRQPAGKQPVGLPSGPRPRRF
jgi:hypothetical protein